MMLQAGPTIHDLPPDAQDRLNAIADDLQTMQMSVVEYFGPLLPLLPEITKHLGILVLKAHARAEHAEHRLSLVEAYIEDEMEEKNAAT